MSANIGTEFAMNNGTSICSLDYLTGTMATAYKGLITALVMKDFCMAEKDGAVTVQGTIIAMPPGTYSICLMQNGIEIRRSELHEGYFELTAGTREIETSGNLQLDVVQEGRHIGTFLLRREKGGGFYSSALEISGDLRGINFKSLEEAVHDQQGIRKKAESIISAVLSVKKDWRTLSEDINSFSNNLFWYSRDAFYLWDRLLIRFLFRACERAGEGSKERMLSNALSFLERPLENETDTGKLVSVVETWVHEAGASGVDFFSRSRQITHLISLMDSRVPGSDVLPLLNRLLSSLKVEAQTAPVISEAALAIMDGTLPGDHVAPVYEFSEASRRDLHEKIRNIELLLEKTAPFPEVLKAISLLDIRSLDRANMAEAVFTVLRAGLEIFDDDGLILILREVLKTIGRLKRDEYRSSIINFRVLVKDLLSAKRTRACALVLDMLSRTDIGEDIVFDRETAGRVLRSEDPGTVNSFIDILLNIRVPPPGISGFSEESWAEITNPLHLKRLSGFLGVLSLDPGKLRAVLIHLICNLAVVGVFIPDDKIFQREISAYLNSADVRQEFLLHYLLLKAFPVYFSDVGASGRIRDFSTEIDSWGDDPVIYFLRKQLHVNASNNNISILKSVITAWVHGDPAALKGAVPDDVRLNLGEEMLGGYSSVIKPLFVRFGIIEADEIKFSRILTVTDESMETYLRESGASEEMRRKVVLLCRLYKEVTGKYSFNTIASGEYPDVLTGLSAMTGELYKLGKIFTAPEKTEPQESLYFKRHIAFGIPSVMGSYHEIKFDALADAFRREERIRLLLEDIIQGAEGKSEPVRDDQLGIWFSYFDKIRELFEFHALGNPVVSEIITVMKSNSLYLSQIIDLIRIWQRELTWIVELFYRTFHKTLAQMLGSLQPEDRPVFLKHIDFHDGDYVDKASDIIIRNMISSVTGLEELDRLLNSFMKTISHTLKEEGDSCFHPVGVREERGNIFVLHELSPERAACLAPYLGGKAKNLVVLKNRGLTVPPGVVLSSALTASYGEYTGSREFGNELEKAVKILEDHTGCTFGGRHNPLLLSVRSGSYISMPGILSTILYCGMNSETVEGLIKSTGDPWHAWDSYRRFIEHFATIALGADMDIFEDVRKGMLDGDVPGDVYGVSAERLREMVAEYLNRLSDMGYRVPSDVFEQLRQSVKAIYRSWHGDRALRFRDAMGVSEHWGTSVTLMQMIYGNRKGAGAAVFFTRRPRSLDRGIYGEIRESATGDDIVYGRFANRPLSREQTNNGGSLEDRDPALYHLYRDISMEIEDAMDGIPQEVESVYVTREGGRSVYILQTKRLEFDRGFTEKFQDICKMESNIIGRGIGVHGGALSGVAGFSVDPERIKKLKAETGYPVILLRRETSTEDVSVMPVIDGIVTARGGATSHAAILAQKFGLSAVVGCPDISLMADGKGGTYAVISGHEVREGTVLSIDGSTGIVYSGVCMFTEKERL